MKSLQRTKTLVFYTWEYFTTWYVSIKQKFSHLVVKYVKYWSGNHQVTVVISY